MTRKEKIIIEKREFFPAWSRVFDSFIRMSYHAPGFDTLDEGGLWLDTEILYNEILETLIQIGGVNDQWEGPEVFPLAVKAGLSVHYRSAQTESRYIFGTDEIGFFLQTDFAYAENIRKMNDDFWFRMAELSQFGRLDRWENIVFTDAQKRLEPWFHRKSGSHIYSLIRNAILLEKEHGTCMDLDSIYVRWDYDTPWEELLDKGGHALRNLYRMNRALWQKRPKSK